MKPGVTTSEFWLACGTQITALIVALSTTDPYAKITAGATALGAVLCYLYHRYDLKRDAHISEQVFASATRRAVAAESTPSMPSGVPCLIAVLLLLGLGGTVQAQHVKPACQCAKNGECFCPPGGCSCGPGVSMRQSAHPAHFNLRLNLWLGPRPVVVAPPAAPPVVAPVQIVYVDPARPVFPGSPVFMLTGPPPVYYQFVPQVPR